MHNRTFIIAEAGVNHNGDENIAIMMVDAAAAAGADAIKFQTFKASSLLVKSAPKAGYQLKNTPGAESQYEMIKGLELSFDAHEKLMKRAKEKNIIFLSSPFDCESVELLAKLGLETFKIPSGEINNVPYLRKIGSLNKNVILSTGMATLGEIEFALKELVRAGTLKDKITVLHCNTQYPTPYEDVNLNAMLTIKNAFKIKIGYSDHTAGIEIPIAAVTLGAGVIEKHFTIDRNMPGPDHKASLVPEELKAMVNAIRHVEAALGSGVKVPSASEAGNVKIARKSIVAARKIRKGEIFDESNICVKRPATGINPQKWDDVVGKPAVRDFEADDPIEL